MPVQDIAIAREDLIVGRSTISLHALTLDDVGRLIIEHGDMFREVVSLFQPVLEDAAHKDQVNWHIFARAPKLLCSAIAMSAGEPDQASVVMSWPAGLQLQAFEVVARLTIPNIDPAYVIHQIGVALAPINGVGETHH